MSEHKIIAAILGAAKTSDEAAGHGKPIEAYMQAYLEAVVALKAARPATKPIGVDHK